MKNVWYYEYPIGRLGIVAEGGAVCLIAFEGDKRFLGVLPQENEVVRKASIQLAEYFSGKRKTFTVPIFLKGTGFQKTVWNVLAEIPIGETRSYKDIAIQAGSPKGFRAVGMANNKNPIMIIIPCHRVLGADGSLTGYAGGLDAKKYLLKLEEKYA